MRSVQDITFDVTGQTIYFDCPEGRPSSVTSVEVFRWDYSDDQTAESAIGTGSVETNPATTLNGAAGPTQTDPNNIPLTATTGIALGRTFLVTAASGVREWVEIESFVSATSARAKHPLHNIYASGAALESTRIQATIDSTWVADLDNLVGSEDVLPNPMYRVRWVYTVGGVKYVADSYFNLVRYAARHGVTPQDMEVFMPSWLDTLPTDHRSDQGRRLIDDAYREVKIDMHAVDLAASAIAQSEIVDELVRYKTVELGEWAKFFAGDNGDEARAQAATKRYTARNDSLTRIVSRVPVRDDTGAATAVMAVGLSRR